MMGSEESPREIRLRGDLQLVADLVEPGTRVLDVGCRDGELLHYLEDYKNVDARGVEIDDTSVRKCVSHGLSVIQGDADTDLSDYPSNAFDCVVLTQTLQTVHSPKTVLEELMRIGDRAIVSFPNFGHWRVRCGLIGGGRMPVTKAFMQPWYETANIHVCTFRDFEDLCQTLDIIVRRRIVANHQGQRRILAAIKPLANLFGEIGIFLLEKK